MATVVTSRFPSMRLARGFFGLGISWITLMATFFTYETSTLPTHCPKTSIHASINCVRSKKTLVKLLASLQFTYCLIFLIFVCCYFDSQTQDSLYVQWCHLLKQVMITDVVKIGLLRVLAMPRNGLFTYVCIQNLYEGLCTLCLHIVIPIFQRSLKKNV